MGPGLAWRPMTSAARRAHWSLRQELTRVLVVAAVLPALVFGLALLWTQWQRDHDDMMVRLANNAQLSANAVDDFLQGQLAGVELLATDPDGDMELLGGGLDRLLRAYPAMLEGSVMDGEGRVLIVRGARGASVAAATTEAGDRDWFRVPRDSGRPHVSNAYRDDRRGGDALVAVSAPLLREGRIDGVLQAAIPVERFIRVRSDSLRRRGFELLLVGRDGRVIHASAGLRWTLLDDLGGLAADLRSHAATPDQPGTPRLVPGVLRDGGSGYVDAVNMRSGWLVAVIAPRQRLDAPAWPRLLLMLGLLGVTTAGVLLALWRLRRLLSESMGKLLDSLRGYALGGALDPVQLTRMPEELQPLEAGIGDLAARMNAAYDELRQVLEQREQVIAERTESLRQAVSDLDRLSRTDALTGSLNYRGFLETADALWRAAEGSGKPLAVLALDIDFFKRYNDLYGHAEGDGALRRFAGAVRSALLHADDVLARPGGEEFIVFLPGSTLEQAMHVGERVCERVRNADIVHAASPEGRLTVSIGVAAMQPGDAEPEEMLRRADAALYRAKSAGRNRASD